MHSISVVNDRDQLWEDIADRSDLLKVYMEVVNNAVVQYQQQ